jgi:CHAD domain-containing protein
MVLDPPTSTYLVPHGVDADAVTSFLAERLPVEADEPLTVETTVLDTVDRRLRDAGVELLLDRHLGAPRLTLRDHSGRPPLVTDVPGAARAAGAGIDPPGGRPVRFLLDDLPPGLLRQRLADVLEERALLPLVLLRLEARSVRVLDEREKTVVRLGITSPLALGAADPAQAFTGGPIDAPDGGVLLATRVVVAGVLGYPKPLARVTALLTEDAGLRTSTSGAADEALRALGGEPDGLRTKVRVPLTPEVRTDRAAVAVLDDLADIATSNLAGTLADLDPEFLHDLRVAVRKSRSVLRELKRAFPPDELARQREALKWVQAITGEVRDLDVQLLEWPALAAKVGPHRRAALEPVHELVARHRAEALRRLVAELEGERFTSTWSSYRAFLAGDLGKAKKRPDAKEPIALTAGRRIRKVYSTMVGMGRAIDDDSPPEDLHELRKRGKELRYLLELFGGLWPAEIVKPMVKTLKGLQDVLGTHQDRAVQVESLRTLVDDLARQPDGPDALLALGSLVDRLEDEEHEARAHFADSFAPFAAKAQRQQVDATFRGLP